MPDHIMHAYSVPQSCQILCDLIDCSLTTGLLCPWDFPGKNTTLCDPMDYSHWNSFYHGATWEC